MDLTMDLKILLVCFLQMGCWPEAEIVGVVVVVDDRQ